METSFSADIAQALSDGTPSHLFDAVETMHLVGDKELQAARCAVLNARAAAEGQIGDIEQDTGWIYLLARMDIEIWSRVSADGDAARFDSCVDDDVLSVTYVRERHGAP